MQLIRVMRGDAKRQQLSNISAEPGMRYHVNHVSAGQTRSSGWERPPNWTQSKDARAMVAHSRRISIDGLQDWRSQQDVY